MDTIRAFLSKIRTLFFGFQKSYWRPPLSSLVGRLWVWLNIHQYPCICLNIAENAWINCFDCQDSEYDDHLTCSTGFSRCLDFRVLNNQGCLCRVEFRICLIMVLYASVMLEHASTCLNVSQYAWTWLNIAKCLWLCLNMPRYSYMLL